MGMFDVDISSILFGLNEDQTAAARSAALRNKPPPPKPPQQPPPPQVAGLGGGATGGWGDPPPPPKPPPRMPPPRPQAPAGGPMLPQSMGMPPQGPPGPPAGTVAVDPDTIWEKQNADLMGKQAKLLAEYQQSLAPPDMGAAQEAYQKRSDQGGRQLLLALAAQHAGEDYKGVQAHFLRQAAEAGEPMKVHGGTMTETGFIEDPGYRQELKLKQIQAQMAQYQHIIDGNNTRQAKIDAAKEMERLKREGWEYARGTAVQVAGITSGDRRYTADKAAETAASPGKATESERSSAGYLGRMEAVEKDINRLAATGQPSLVTKGLGTVGLGRIARPYVETTDQQQYRAVQEDWVRAKLRKESGASIPPDEMEREIETYFPQPGETDPKVIKIKAQARLQAQEQLRTSAGRVTPTQAPAVPDAAPAAGKPTFAVNPTTGERLQLVGGKWVPVP